MNSGPAKATILTAWIIRRNEDFPRLAACYNFER